MSDTPGLFHPLRLRGVELRNRIGVSPMCQYSCVDGFANDWHLVHLGALARGGAGLVIAESTSVTFDGRISPDDLGLWKDEQIQPLRPVTRFVKQQGAVAGIQLSHAGRKAAMPSPWKRGGWVGPDQGGWDVVGPGQEPFADGYGMPRELTAAEIAELPSVFAAAARRALRAGFELIELHGAHGYLLNQFLSPLSNQRTDAWGGSFDNRVRLTLAVAAALREEIGTDVPLLTRLSATDWAPGGWDGDDTVRLAPLLARVGVDLVDCSSGGNHAQVEIPIGSGYQVEFARRVRQEAGVPSAAVGLIEDPAHADALVRDGDCDLVLLGRALLRNPSWPQEAARALGVDPHYPDQYGWALRIRPEAIAASTSAGAGAG